MIISINVLNVKGTKFSLRGDMTDDVIINFGPLTLCINSLCITETNITNM